jgi:hypothetical protein
MDIHARLYGRIIRKTRYPDMIGQACNYDLER